MSKHKHMFSEAQDSEAGISVLLFPVHLYPMLEASCMRTQVPQDCDPTLRPTIQYPPTYYLKSYLQEVNIIC